MTLNGYDISAYQGSLDPAAVPGDFVQVKITGGDGYLNPNWRRQFDAARAAGKLVGVYHFARDGYTNATAHSEAQWFIQNASSVLDGTVIAVLDWEGDNVGDVAYAKAWLDEVTAATGVRPLIYASYATVEAYDWSPVANANYGLWESAYVLGYQKINGYNAPAGRAAIPYWNTIAEWQYTSVGQLPGWPNDLDLDIFYGDATTWAAYAAKNGTVQPANGGNVTPIPEDDMTPDQAAQLAYIASPQFKIDLWTATATDEAAARQKFVGNDIFGRDFSRQGGQSGTVNLGAVVANFDAAVANLVTAIDTHTDADIKSVALNPTDAQVQVLVDKLNATLPANVIAALKAKL